MAKTRTTSRPQHRSRRAKRNASTWLPWGIGGALLTIVVLLVARSLMTPRSPGKGPRDTEWLAGQTGGSYDAGETDYDYPNPAGLEAGRKWLPALGETDAPVVVIEFSDVFCSHCRDFNLDSLPAILEDYVATGKVRYVDHFFGFAGSIERGTVSALLCAAEQGRYFEFKHALFQSQELGAYDASRSARVAGLDSAQLEACLADQRYVGAMQEMVYVDNSGVSSTPTFFVNGTMVSGNDPQGIRRLIDIALSEE